VGFELAKLGQCKDWGNDKVEARLGTDVGDTLATALQDHAPELLHRRVRVAIDVKGQVGEYLRKTTVRCCSCDGRVLGLDLDILLAHIVAKVAEGDSRVLGCGEVVVYSVVATAV
jgi:hypothetical protein